MLKIPTTKRSCSKPTTTTPHVMPKSVTTTYKEEGKVKICKRCPGEHELHGIVDEFQLRKKNFKASIVIHTRHEIEIKQIDIHTWRKILRKKFWPDVQILKKYTVA